MNKITTDYWFTIEPYVYIGLSKHCVLLYNTLDGATIKSEKSEVINLLYQILEKENYGVVLLENSIYQKENIKSFIKELREKYMGDIIKVGLSTSKPIQILPFFNSLYQDKDKLEIYKKQNFYSHANVIDNLHEICIHVDYTIETSKLISFLQSLPNGIILSFIGNMQDVKNYDELLSCTDRYPSPKKMICSYMNTDIQTAFQNKFSYNITVDFPVDMCKWTDSLQLLRNQTLPFEHIFEITSDESYQQAEQLIEQFHLEKYSFKPIYTGTNLLFFENEIFLTEEDILEKLLSIKDIFIHQMMNTYDFGKINIMSNGDVYANINQPLLGNIYVHSLKDIIRLEIEKGKSWFRIRNQCPCNNCVYQWLCPSPSDYEIVIGRLNLCHLKNENN